MDVKKQVEKHKAQSIHYLKNALHFIEAGDAEKASEFLWGSMAQAIKAVALSKGIRLRSHQKLREYVIELARYCKDMDIKNTFDRAQSLHSNFYETGLLMEDVAMAAEDVRVAVAKLLSLIPKES